MPAVAAAPLDNDDVALLPPPNVKVKVVLAAVVEALAFMPDDAEGVAAGVVDATGAPHVQENWEGWFGDIADVLEVPFA